MKTSSNWKIILGLAAIFALGAASGSLVTARLHPAAASVKTAPPPEEKWRSLALTDYEQRLGLTPEQVEKLKPIFGLTSRKLATLRSNTAERIAQLIHEMNGEVMTELTPEQQTKLKQMLEERRKLIPKPE